MQEADFKVTSKGLIIALWLAILIYLAGVTWLMVDVQSRLGKTEHRLMHAISIEKGHFCEEVSPEE